MLQKYKKDFPDEGTFNWKVVVITDHKDKNWVGIRRLGVVLHDGNLMINGILFKQGSFRIIDENPIEKGRVIK